MPISLDELRVILKTIAPSYRDSAPTTAEYPHIIYEFVNEIPKRASNKVLFDMPLYQVAYITNGVESELKALKKALNDNEIIYDQFMQIPYDENDDTITQFITYVRCIE